MSIFTSANRIHFIAGCRISLLALMAFSLLGLTARVASSEDQLAAAPSSETTTSSGRKFLREGTTLDRKLGRFRSSGDRLSFYSQDGTQVLQALENLALERISDVISSRLDQRNEMIWEVSGIVTEFRGTNYLFIEHAAFQPRTLSTKRRP